MLRETKKKRRLSATWCQQQLLGSIGAGQHSIDQLFKTTMKDTLARLASSRTERRATRTNPPLKSNISARSLHKIIGVSIKEWTISQIQMLEERLEQEDKHSWNCHQQNWTLAGHKTRRCWGEGTGVEWQAIRCSRRIDEEVVFTELATSRDLAGKSHAIHSAVTAHFNHFIAELLADTSLQAMTEPEVKILQ